MRIVAALLAALLVGFSASQRDAEQFVPLTGTVRTTEVIIAEAVTVDTVFHRSAGQRAVAANVSTARGWLARYYLSNASTELSVISANGTIRCFASKWDPTSLRSMPLPSLWHLEGFTARGPTTYNSRAARIYRNDRDRYLQLMLVDEETGDVLFRSAANYAEAQGVVHSVTHTEPPAEVFTPPPECNANLRLFGTVPDIATAQLELLTELWRERSMRDGDGDVSSFIAPAMIDNSPFATPVRDQGQCGCCWSVATAGLAEVVSNVARNRTVSRGDITGWLSFQSLVDCVHGDENIVPTRGCLGGNPITAAEWVATNGVATEATYNYDGINGAQCHIASPDVETVHPLSRAIVVPPFNATAMAAAVARYGAVTASIQVLPDYERWPGGRVYDNPNCSIGFDHVILIVGYGIDTHDSGLPYWLVKNSHGPGWGEAGYYRIRRGVNMCGVETIPVTAEAVLGTLR